MGHSWEQWEIRLFEEMRQRGALISFDDPVKKWQGPKQMICIMCNAGPQVLDRIYFYQNYLVEIIHPVMSHGGVYRLTPGKFFDQSLCCDIKEAREFFPEASIAGEGHYPCANAARRKMNFRVTLTETLLGLENLGGMLKRWGISQDLYGFFHVDWRSTEHPGKKMETFWIDPDRAMKVLSHPHI